VQNDLPIETTCWRVQTIQSLLSRSGSFTAHWKFSDWSHERSRKPCGRAIRQNPFGVPRVTDDEVVVTTSEGFDMMVPPIEARHPDASEQKEAGEKNREKVAVFK
jgi:hypothetical protein